MSKQIRKQLEAVSLAVSKVVGFYHRWAQQNAANYYVLQVFYALQAEGPLTQKHISENYEMPKQTVNKVVTLLKKEKYITLKASKADKREKIILLTKLGEEYSRELLAPLFKIEEQAVTQIGLDSFRQLSELLATYGNALEMGLEDLVSTENKKNGSKTKKKD